MWQPSPPPAAPKEAGELLLELAAYYQELVAYHQKAAQEAIVHLSHVEALLGSGKSGSGESVHLEEQPREQEWKQQSRPEREVPLLSSSKGVEERKSSRSDEVADTYAKTSPSYGNGEGRISNSEVEGSGLRGRRQRRRRIGESVGGEVLTLEGLEAATTWSTEASSEKAVTPPGEKNWNREIVELLELNRGKILQIDYMARELSQNQELIEKQELESILVQGEKEELWASVPEAPGCWTIDLKEIAEVGVKSKSQKKKKRRRKNLTPKKGKMRQYQTLTQAVTDCVSQNYPQVMTTDKISEWLYPRGLSATESQQVKNAIGKVLSKGSGDLWTRVAVGKYVWKGEREENQSGSTS